jgi:hypothetical protein
MLAKYLYRAFSDSATMMLNKRSLKEFYKAIHPDLLEKAPLKVKEENERSLKLLNDYLDRIKHNAGSPKLALKFYAPNKDNEKSKKFLYFEIDLDSFISNTDADYLKIHESRVMNKLLSTITNVQLQNNPFGVVEKKPKGQESIQFEREMPELFVKSSSKQEKIREVSRFKKIFNENIFEHQKEEVASEIRRNLMVMYPDIGEYDGIVEEMIGELSSDVLEKEMLDCKIDPKIFFVSAEIKPGKVHRFFRGLVDLVLMSKDDAKFYGKVQNFIQANQPRLKILVGQKNEVMPTFIGVDADAPVRESLQFIASSITQSLEKRDEFSRNNSSIEKYRSEIEQKFGIKFIDLHSEMGEGPDSELSENKKYLFLKKVLKVFKLIQDQNQRYPHTEGLHIKLTLGGETLDAKKKELALKWNFDEKKVVEFLVAAN